MISAEPEPGARSVAATAALLAEAFPESVVSRPDYLSWLYERSPFGPVLETNLDDPEGRAGHYALVPIQLSRNGVDRRAVLSLNTAVHKRARNRGLFVELARQTIAKAQSQGIESVVGVANANSTPGFIRHLDFTLLAQLPATVLIPTPGPTRAVHSGWADASSFPAADLVPDLTEILRAPAAGEARRWTAATLGWRLASPGASYALHRAEGLLAVSCRDDRYRVGVAVILKVFAAGPVSASRQRTLVRGICRFHRAPVALHVGLNDRLSFQGVALPRRLRPSPLNLIYRSLTAGQPRPSIAAFELLDFDAY